MTGSQEVGMGRQLYGWQNHRKYVQAAVPLIGSKDVREDKCTVDRITGATGRQLYGLWDHRRCGKTAVRLAGSQEVREDSCTVGGVLLERSLVPLVGHHCRNNLEYYKLYYTYTFIHMCTIPTYYNPCLILDKKTCPFFSKMRKAKHAKTKLIKKYIYE